MSGMFGQVTPIQVPDFAATAARAQQYQQNRLAMLAQQRQLDQQQREQDFFAQYGAGLASPDPGKRQNILAMLAQQGPRGAALALPQLQQMRDDSWQTAGTPAPTGGAAPAPVAMGPGEVPANLAPLIEQASRETGIPAPVLTALYRQESNLGRDPRAAANGGGPAQIVGGTARNPGFGLPPISDADRLNPATAIPWSARYLAARARALGVTDWNDPAQRNRALAAYNGGGDPNYVQNVSRWLPPSGGAPAQSGDVTPAAGPVTPGAAPADATAPALQRTPSGRIIVPGFDMATVERAFAAPSSSASAQAYIRRYNDALAQHMQAIQLERRGETARPVEIADPTSPTGRRLVAPQQAMGAPAPGGNLQTVDLGQGAPEGPGRYRVNPDGTMTRQSAIPEREAQAQAPFAMANTLRDEYTNLTKDFRTVQTAYQNIQSSARAQNGAGDMSMLYSFVRMLDPTSVVRESEFAAAAAAGSYGERIQGAAQRILSGARLPDSLRQSFIDEARNLFENQRRGYDRVGEYFRGVATRNNLNPEDIVIPFSLPEEQRPDATAIPTPPATAGAVIGGGAGGLSAEPPATPPGLPQGAVVRRYNPRTGRVE